MAVAALVALALQAGVARDKVLLEAAVDPGQRMQLRVPQTWIWQLHLVKIDDAAPAEVAERRQAGCGC